MTNIREARVFGFFLMSVLVLFLSIIYMTQATTVGGSITVDSALTVGGVTTLNGSSTFGDAAADINLFTGTLQASTTALFTSGFTTYGNSTFGDAAADVNLFTGRLQASTTALFTAGITTYGNSTFGDAAADTNIFTGTLQASTTALFTGDITSYGAGTFGDAAGDNYRFVGGLQATSTLGVTGTTFLYSDLRINGFATTTGTSGNIRTEGSVGIATTTSMTSNVVLGVQGTGTTTIAIGTSGGTNVGSCIQLRGLDGQSFRVFAAATTSTTKQLVVEVGSCNGN